MTDTELEEFRREMCRVFARKAPRGELEDVVQHGFLAWWKHKDKVKVENVKGYIVRSITNRLIDIWIRDEKKPPPYNIDVTPVSLPPPDRQVIDQMTMDEYLDHLSYLSEIDREMLMCILDTEPSKTTEGGRSMARGAMHDICDELGISHTAARTRRWRMVQKVKERGLPFDYANT